ncbi:MAG: glycoside hydrolase family 172 protein [Armatimonadota bacterium]
MFDRLVSGTGGSPLRGLANARNSRSRRVSSYDVTGGNADCKQIRPGETLVLADIHGAGCINHIWFTIWHEEKLWPRKMVLRMYWDGEESPSVECPVGDFFGVGHGRVRHYVALALNMVGRRENPTELAMNCFFPMPFARQARITMTNESEGLCKSMYYYIDYEELDSLGDDALRFHAWWNREEDTGGPGASAQDGLINLDGKHNYVIVDAEGRGHYVGCNISIDNTEGQWPGEGDDMIFIDGESWPPSLHGTGTEDYFCSAWGFPCGEYAGPYHGVTLLEDPVESKGKTTVYRHHIEDPVVFHKSIRVTIEHRHGNAGRDDWSSVGYWYQTEPHKPFPPMLPVEKRLPKEAKS